MNTINTNSGDNARSPFFVLNSNCYNVTPFLNMAISLYPFISFFTFSPFAVVITLSMKSFRRVSMSTPSTSFPALKSIQFCFDLKICELVLIFIVGELVIIAMMAGGMLEIIRENGGIDYIISKITNKVNGKRGAELAIATLVSFVNICTANNTVAILTVGSIAKKIGDRYGVDNRKAASILDTFSCCVQGLIPYGVQMLLAAGLSGVSPIQILPYLYYPMAIGFAAFMSIMLRYPKRFS